VANRAAPHTALCKAIESYILWCGGYIVKNLGGLGVRRGRPDFDACIRGKFVAIEAKTGSGELGPDQVKERNRLEIAGAIYIEARSVDDVEKRLIAEGLALPSLLS
jgi:hypothetical protein